MTYQFLTPDQRKHLDREHVTAQRDIAIRLRADRKASAVESLMIYGGLAALAILCLAGVL